MNLASDLFQNTPAPRSDNLPVTPTEHLPDLQVHDGQVTTTSVEVARIFEKQHKNVLQSIPTLLTQLPEINRLNFQPVQYTDGKGELRPAHGQVRITPKGLTRIGESLSRLALSV